MAIKLHAYPIFDGDGVTNSDNCGCPAPLHSQVWRAATPFVATVNPGRPCSHGLPLVTFGLIENDLSYLPLAAALRLIHQLIRHLDSSVDGVCRSQEGDDANAEGY